VRKEKTHYKCYSCIVWSDLVLYCYLHSNQITSNPPTNLIPTFVRTAAANMLGLHAHGHLVPAQAIWPSKLTKPGLRLTCKAHRQQSRIFQPLHYKILYQKAIFLGFVTKMNLKCI